MQPTKVLRWFKDDLGGLTLQQLHTAEVREFVERREGGEIFMREELVEKREWRAVSIVAADGSPQTIPVFTVIDGGKR
jgi:hypothetical protein